MSKNTNNQKKTAPVRSATQAKAGKRSGSAVVTTPVINQAKVAWLVKVGITPANVAHIKATNIEVEAARLAISARPTVTPAELAKVTAIAHRVLVSKIGS